MAGHSPAHLTPVNDPAARGRRRGMVFHALFDSAAFTGEARFGGAAFTGTAEFGGAMAINHTKRDAWLDGWRP